MVILDPAIIEEFVMSPTRLIHAPKWWDRMDSSGGRDITFPLVWWFYCWSVLWKLLYLRRCIITNYLGHEDNEDHASPVLSRALEGRHITHIQFGGDVTMAVTSRGSTFTWDSIKMVNLVMAIAHQCDTSRNHPLSKDCLNTMPWWCQVVFS